LAIQTYLFPVEHAKKNTHSSRKTIPLPCYRTTSVEHKTHWNQLSYLLLYNVMFN